MDISIFLEKKKVISCEGHDESNRTACTAVVIK